MLMVHPFAMWSRSSGVGNVPSGIRLSEPRATVLPVRPCATLDSCQHGRAMKYQKFPGTRTRDPHNRFCARHASHTTQCMSGVEPEHEGVVGVRAHCASEPYMLQYTDWLNKIAQQEYYLKVRTKASHKFSDRGMPSGTSCSALV